MTTMQMSGSEKRRLEALSRLEILDTPRETVFDRVVVLAAAVFRVPIAAISMIAEKRQWLKAHVGGLSVEIPREISFCSYVIAAGAPVVVDDATADLRFHCNPLVTASPKIRFYAGVPIKGPDAQLVGALCIIDVVPRTLDRTQLLILTQIGDDVSEFLQMYPALQDPRIARLGAARST